ncbi:unnamed protein product [Anisakis simplex]|uniref:G_PROTEIN_RECEP_F1_2 domain-containing protein n=1 Tax=Anisakis simplex TaxID=6269 RepID=A0A0M3JT21_ANISI|nr:unnamed protein product [Anisakis simplex]
MKIGEDLFKVPFIRLSFFVLSSALRIETKCFYKFSSLWLTPVYTYVGHWIWGGWLCYGLPLFQGTSIFISTLTLMAIAIDRYFVIVHHSSSSANMNDHMSMPVCIAIITLIWAVSLLLVMPYAVHMRMTYIPRPCDFWLCLEDWAMEDLKSMYGIIVMALQRSENVSSQLCHFLRGGVSERSKLCGSSSVKDQQQQRHLSSEAILNAIIDRSGSATSVGLPSPKSSISKALGQNPGCSRWSNASDNSADANNSVNISDGLNHGYYYHYYICCCHQYYCFRINILEILLA